MAFRPGALGHFPPMAENVQYAGPHDAADLQIADGVYVTVLNREVTDEQAHTLGYALDADEAVKLGRPFVRRTITVSDELASLLTGVYANADGELVETWPRAGGTASDDKIVDDPSSNPAVRDYELDDGTVLSAAELNLRVAEAAEADVNVQAVNERIEADPALASSLRDDLRKADEHIEELQDALGAGDADADEREVIERELGVARESRANIAARIEGENA